MKQYKKGDPEYLSNGHFTINGTDYMSIWAFKKRYELHPNDNDANGDDGIKLSRSGIPAIDSEPDFGNFSSVLLYPVSELEAFFNVVING
jgi:hypothetical protein